MLLNIKIKPKILKDISGIAGPDIKEKGNNTISKTGKKSY